MGNASTVIDAMIGLWLFRLDRISKESEVVIAAVHRRFASRASLAHSSRMERADGKADLSIPERL